MAAQYTATQIRTTWDAMITAYVALRGGTEDDVMNSAVDMRSVDDLGPWDLVDETTVAGLNPNNRVQIAFTDGTDTLVFNYDEMANFDATGAFAKLDQYFGPHFKIWVMLESIKAAVEAAAIGGTFAMPDPGALWNWDDYYGLVAAIAGEAGRPEYSGLTSGMQSDALGGSQLFPAEID